MSSSTMAQTQGRVTYISQQNRIVDITPASPDDTTMWLAASMTRQEIKASGAKHTVYVRASLPNGSRKRYPRRISYEALQIFSTAIYWSAWSSVISDDHVYGISVPVTSYEGLVPILEFIERTVGDDDGRVGSVGMQHKTPFYRYYRETQVAQSLGSRPIMMEMIGRLQGMRYKDKKPWGIQMEDMQLVYTHVKDPKHFVRQNISVSIARALLDKCLKDAQKVQEFMRDNPVVDQEIMALYHEEQEYRKAKAEEDVRAARRAKRGY
ncbi:hypothetical protein LTR70_001226 [Exophiala xenobiotica]|uniref:Uncharacterized protein n=1 Tax=Lithohypha guttulata TaxID=1690604 RepID=A0ABR0KKT7_9EURO|nr:hypothetical protein LTR24_001477 [Lithohypha guttulata]KAK5328201.1 hypothetical protein LTR70_001226 [Exophiala xenobiotica]